MAGSDSEKQDDLPETIEAAVQFVLSRMSEDLRVWLRRFNGDEIELYLQLAMALTPGMGVRNMLGLWGKNPKLLAELPREYKHPDSASMFILIECWRRLQAETKQA